MLCHWFDDGYCLPGVLGMIEKLTDIFFTAVPVFYFGGMLLLSMGGHRISDHVTGLQLQVILFTGLAWTIAGVCYFVGSGNVHKKVGKTNTFLKRAQKTGKN